MDATAAEEKTHALHSAHEPRQDRQIGAGAQLAQARSVRWQARAAPHARLKYAQPIPCPVFPMQAGSIALPARSAQPINCANAPRCTLSPPNQRQGRCHQPPCEQRVPSPTMYDVLSTMEAKHPF
ncbi:MAG: hypothetical protein IPJ05_12730 [Nitrosomonas sp.]|nr:hypothetical protein [Nitrosomonas sp.]